MKIEFATINKRVKAAIIDSIFLIVIALLVGEFFAVAELNNATFKIIAFVLIFILYDPFFTSFYGATIGHSYNHISVKQENNPKKNINFHHAFIRFLIKVSLGWLSLLSIINSTNKKAIHDYAVKSIVIEN